VFGTAARALASVGVAAALFAGLSGYTVAQAADALPGDRLYGVKLQTERVRLALAFTEGAERDIRLDIASERVHEIEELTARGKIIGPGVIERLRDQTEPLADALEDLDSADAARVKAVTTRSSEALERAEPQIAPEAQSTLEEAQAFVKDVALRAGVVEVSKSEPGAVLTPEVLVNTPVPEDTPEPSSTPDASSTPASSPTAQATPTAAREGVVVGPTPVGVDIGVTWVRIAVERFTTLIPSPQDGWSISGVNPGRGSTVTPNLVTITNANGTQIITMNPRNGDMYWFIALNGVFDEIQLRASRDGQTFVVDRQLLTRLYGPLADVPLYILDHIELAPLPTPAPTATPPAPSPTTVP
jgi:hypothetical protein